MDVSLIFVCVMVALIGILGWKLSAFFIKVSKSRNKMIEFAKSIESIAPCASNSQCQKTIRCYSKVDFPQHAAAPNLDTISDFGIAFENVEILSKSEFCQLLLSNNKQNNNKIDSNHDFILTPFCIDPKTSSMIFIPININNK